MYDFNSPSIWDKTKKAASSASDWLSDSYNTTARLGSDVVDYTQSAIKDGTQAVVDTVAPADPNAPYQSRTEFGGKDSSFAKDFGQDWEGNAFAPKEFEYEQPVPDTSFGVPEKYTPSTEFGREAEARASTLSNEDSGINWQMVAKDTLDAISKMPQEKPMAYPGAFRPKFTPTKIDDSIQKAQMANTNQMDINAILAAVGGGVRR